MISPMRNARFEPQMSPSLPPVSMNEAIVSVYRVMAVCTSPTVVSRSSTSAEIDTFINVVSMTYTNIAADSTARTTYPLAAELCAVLAFSVRADSRVVWTAI